MGFAVPFHIVILFKNQNYPSLTHFAVLAEESEASLISNLKRSTRPFELPAIRAMRSKVGRFH